MKSMASNNEYLRNYWYKNITIKSLLTVSLVQQDSPSDLLVIMEKMTNIDGLEKALEIMRSTSDAVSNTAMESISYEESYNKDGISFDINGQGFVRNLKFANGTPPSMV